MERIKSLCSLILCSSILIFCTTFVDEIYPEGKGKAEAYHNLVEQYQKILDNSSMEEKDAKNFISEEEFTSKVDRNVIKEKAQAALENTDIYRLTLEDEQKNEVSEQFALLYEQQIAVQENVGFNSSMRLIRSTSLLLGLLSIAIILIINMQCKNKRRKKLRKVESKVVEKNIEIEKKEKEENKKVEKPKVETETIKKEDVK